MAEQDWTNHHFERWLILGPTETPGRWYAQCECGREKTVLIGNLISKHSKSCGCLRDAKMIARNLKHGHSIGHFEPDCVPITPELSAWLGMIQRCTNPKYEHFDAYGGRGICVCSRWRNDSVAFLSDMGKRPEKGYSLDRRDMNGNYSCGRHDLCEDCRVNGWPANCRWATLQEQRRNTRGNRNFTFNGETMCLAAWAERYKLSIGVLRRRLVDNKWPIEEALTEPSRRYMKYPKTEPAK